jgi:glycerophosphoryl diester phosphodiesterase
VVGHRGDSFLHPEDTLVAIESAFQHGAKLVEIDIRLTSDDQVVLMHDAEIDRTTSGSGFIADMSLAELRGLDAGSWRASQFVGEPVPTLTEALMLAEQYDRQLYLDIKVNGMEQPIATAMAALSVPADRVVLSLSSVSEVDSYHAVLPDTPITYWGGLPPASDTAWFESMKAKNVTVLEQGWPWHLDADFPQYRAMADALGFRLGSFTANQYELMAEGVDAGLDWIETDLPEALHDIACEGGDGGLPPPPRAVGAWNFDGDMTGVVGSRLRHFGASSPANQQETLGTTQSFGLPNIGGKVAGVLRVPAYQPDHGIEMFTNLNPWGESVSNTAYNGYTLIFDLLKPQASFGSWTPLFQTGFGNGNDAELYISPTGTIGIDGTYHGQLQADTWYRIVIVVDISAVDPSVMAKYVDGTLVGTNDAGSVDGRFSLESNYVLGHALLFTDDDGDTSEFYVSSVQLRDYPMTAAEVAALGGPTAAGIPLP